MDKMKELLIAEAMHKQKFERTAEAIPPTLGGHVRLSKLVRKDDKGVSSSAVQAADAIADAGGSPRAQIDAARDASGARLSYNAHVGSVQAERGLRQLAKKFLPCPICHGVEGCDHSIPERKAAWYDPEI